MPKDPSWHSYHSLPLKRCDRKVTECLVAYLAKFFLSRWCMDSWRFCFHLSLHSPLYSLICIVLHEHIQKHVANICRHSDLNIFTDIIWLILSLHSFAGHARPWCEGYEGRCTKRCTLYCVLPRRHLLFGPLYLSIFEKGGGVQTIAKINVSEESCARTCLNQATSPSDEGLLQFSLAGISKFREFGATVVRFLEERLPLDLQQDFSE